MEPNKDLVDTAVKFLLNPKVRNATDDQKRQFLAGKGLSAAEVQAALDRSSAAGAATLPADTSRMPPQVSRNQLYTPVAVHEQAPWLLQGWRGIATLAGLIAALITAAYKFYKIYILPWIRERQEQRRALKDLSDKLEALKTSVEGTMVAVKQTKEQIEQISTDKTNAERVERLAKEVKGELGSVKSLLLNRQQFAPPPRITPAIPAWQIQSSTSSQKDEPQNSSTPRDSVNTSREEEKSNGLSPEENGSDRLQPSDDGSRSLKTTDANGSQDGETADEPDVRDPSTEELQSVR